MPDYGRDVAFGVFPAPELAKLDELFAMAAAADRGGLDLVGVQDHPYQRRFVDTFVLLGAILERTERVRVFPDVANLPLRPPAMLAKATATLDLLSGGRCELGLGAGSFWDAIEAMGGPRRVPGDAAGALVEAVEVIRLLWSTQSSTRFEGRHYQLTGAKPGPQPAHPVGIWLGVTGPRMLDFLGRAADGWVPSSGFVPPPRLGDLHRRIDDGAHAADRDPAEIRRVYNVWGTVTTGASGGFLNGPVGQWVDELTTLVLESGMDTFVFGPADDPVRQTEVFAAEVAPAVREAVAVHRGS
jgi:alkanesulfonate monooxygenase SsuD/methylene tetrahydromethanopterin reductase-like flavin-dependent oxidoreductase (luciferase family)